MSVPELQPTYDSLEERMGRELAALNFSITALDSLVNEADENEMDVACLAFTLKTGREYAGYLKDVLASLERLTGDRMKEYRVTVEGVGTLERHKNTSYTKWDTDALLHDVLDTRVMDTKTGEVIEETPLDKVLAVWNLGAPRRTVLKDRGLQPDQYAQVEDRGGWKLVLK